MDFHTHLKTQFRFSSAIISYDWMLCMKIAQMNIFAFCSFIQVPMNLNEIYWFFAREYAHHRSIWRKKEELVSKFVFCQKLLCFYDFVEKFLCKRTFFVKNKQKLSINVWNKRKKKSTILVNKMTFIFALYWSVQKW